MIITVQGSQYGNNGSAQLIAALSFVGIAKDKRSTLIVQLENRTNKNVENYLIGQSVRNESLIKDASIPDISSGMDALMMHSSDQVNAKLLQECTRPLVVSSSANVYDIAFSSRRDSFEKEIMDKNARESDDGGYITSFLRNASEAYDMVYVMLPSKNLRLCTAALECADVNIVTVIQGRAEAVNLCKKRNIFVAYDYCSGSAYGSKSLMKAYNIPTIYGMMHSVAFNDACAEGTVLNFMNQNIKDTPENVNYDFVHNIELIYHGIMRDSQKKVDESPIDSVIKKNVEDPFIATEWAPVDENVKVEVRKRGNVTRLVAPDPDDQENN